VTLPPGNPMIRVLQVFLLLDVIVFALVIPGMIQVSDRSVAVSVGSGVVAILIAVAAAGTIRRGRLGFALGWLTQLVGLALGLSHTVPVHHRRRLRAAVDHDVRPRQEAGHPAHTLTSPGSGPRLPGRQWSPH